MPGSGHPALPRPGGGAWRRPRFAEVHVPREPLDGEEELAWLDAAAQGRAQAVIWSGRQGLVAPVSYRRHESLERVCAQFAARGWPVRLRRSGGGVVPQGPGVLNLSLAYAVDGEPGDYSDEVYGHLCGVLAQALAGLGIPSEARAVHGSFCDGRYNLAVSAGGPWHKIVGTAQYWRRSGEQHAVLAHALMLVDADTEALTAEANAFEAALGSDRRYRAGALVSVTQAWRSRHARPDVQSNHEPAGDVSGQLVRLITAALST